MVCIYDARRPLSSHRLARFGANRAVAAYPACRAPAVPQGKVFTMSSRGVACRSRTALHQPRLRSASNQSPSGSRCSPAIVRSPTSSCPSVPSPHPICHQPAMPQSPPCGRLKGRALAAHIAAATCSSPNAMPPTAWLSHARHASHSPSQPDRTSSDALTPELRPQRVCARGCDRP